MFQTSWDSPENIPNETLLELFYGNYPLYDDYWDIEDCVHKVPFDVPFNFYKEYFDISEEQIKSLDVYDEESNCFVGVFGSSQCYGNARGLEIDSVKEEGNKLTIHFYSFVASFSPEQRILPKTEWYKDCTLTMVKTEDGLKYQSFDIKNYTPPALFKEEA